MEFIKHLFYSGYLALDITQCCITAIIAIWGFLYTENYLKKHPNENKKVHYVCTVILVVLAYFVLGLLKVPAIEVITDTDELFRLLGAIGIVILFVLIFVLSSVESVFAKLALIIIGVCIAIFIITSLIDIGKSWGDSDPCDTDWPSDECLRMND